MRAPVAASALVVTAAVGLTACGSSSSRPSGSHQAHCPPSSPAATATTPAQTGHAAHPANERTIVTGTASGHCPIAKAAGTVQKPVSITLRGVAEPPQGARLSWAFSCEKKSGGTAKSSGHMSLSLPGNETPRLPAPAAKCTVSATAQLDKSGHVLLSIVSPHQTS
jgi:hypothetical protein